MTKEINNPRCYEQGKCFAKTDKKCRILSNTKGYEFKSCPFKKVKATD